MVYIKTKEEIAAMREGGKILARILHALAEDVKPGVTTGRLEDLAYKLMTEAGGKPAFKGYKSSAGARGFPTVICASINHEVVHAPALPSRVLEEGDLIGIDIGMEYLPPLASGKTAPDKHAITGAVKNFPKNKYSASGGFITDMALTAGAGEIGEERRKLLEVTKKALELGIAEVKPGKKLSDIGRAIDDYVRKNGFSVVRALVGHGVGYEVHEDPQVPNYFPKEKDFKDIVLRPGMVIAIEPMVNAGEHDIESDADGFTIVTSDGSLSAHFEHTVAVTERGHEILTLE
ncbi:MAG: type I methionyl aminopeptidase [Patescibacteria group bacterium]|jgi:methionyl aminopeptidase